VNVSWIEGEVYVFDVDGVLVDASERLREALHRIGVMDIVHPRSLNPRLRARFWRVFLSEELLAYDRPRRVGINMLLDRLNRGVVLILTGRPYRLRRATLRELEEAGIPVRRALLIMRPRGDRRRDYEFKSSVLRRIPRVVEVHDDELEVLERVRRIHPSARLYLHFKDYYTII